MAYIRIDKDMDSDPRLLVLAHDIAASVFVCAGENAVDSDIGESATRNVICNALLGSLVTLWCYADTHIRADDTIQIGIDVLAAIIGLPVEWVKKFPAEWLVVHGNGTVELPDYCAKNGLISKEKRREQGRERVRRFRAKQTDSVTSPVTHPVTHPVTQGNASPPYPDQTVTNIKKQTKKTAAAAAGSLSRSEHDFSVFWEKYPKKVGKEAARKTWAKIKNSAEVLVLCVEALAWQIESEQWKKDGGQFIPNPATYLNQQRWLDEKPPAVVETRAKAPPNWFASDEATIKYGESLGVRARPGEHMNDYRARLREFRPMTGTGESLRLIDGVTAR